MPSPSGIGQVERFADQVIGHAGGGAERRQVREEAPERRAIGQEDGEVIEPERGAPRRRRDAGPRFERHSGSAVVLRGQLRRARRCARCTRSPSTRS